MASPFLLSELVFEVFSPPFQRRVRSTRRLHGYWSAYICKIIAPGSPQIWASLGMNITYFRALTSCKFGHLSVCHVHVFMLYKFRWYIILDGKKLFAHRGVWWNDAISFQARQMSAAFVARCLRHFLDICGLTHVGCTRIRRLHDNRKLLWSDIMTMGTINGCILKHMQTWRKKCWSAFFLLPPPKNVRRLSWNQTWFNCFFPNYLKTKTVTAGKNTSNKFSG